MTKFEAALSQYKHAVKNIEEVLQEEKNEFIRDSAIKRFELTFDLAWKTVKAFLEEYHNAICVSPKTCFREAFNKGVISYDDYWIELANVRNNTVHTYNEILAEEIYKKLPQALSHFQKLLSAIA